MSGSRKPGATLALVVAVAVAGCGGEGGGEDEAAPAPRPTPTPVERVVSANLTGAAEDGGSATGTGRVVIELSSKTGKACWTLSVKGLDKALSAHVHAGRPGVTGRVVIPLGSRFAKEGCVRVPVAAIRAVATKPAEHYVNVYTTKHIDGAIRGQLRAGS